MSDYIPVFAIVLDANELPLRLESCNDANDIVGVRGDLWESVSRNNWHQAILEKILKRRKEYSELLYLIQEIVCIHSTDLPRKIKALRSFLQPRFSISARSEGAQGVEDGREKLKNSRRRSHSTVTGCFSIFLAQIQRLVRPR